MLILSFMEKYDHSTCMCIAQFNPITLSRQNNEKKGKKNGDVERCIFAELPVDHSGRAIKMYKMHSNKN